ncbi:membrane fusion protein (multidrug efflux system) [Pedobacter psychrotolerans]|uniref:Membrane fusion protein (Multidrug efflux system) n=1 Tax=Pedobacter psychrotolerans TaxID=1843235 RepID=A0A4R2HIZ9_9SPHI|nr:HlyD family secretion protein [Pedobacter psychrotolerans]TCO26953.1 membrane fusion protein (multidrug efflux system) [Pedobacter psychrotolerans]GGE57823.1 secretion protein HlyD [Pedobacter psychrotolerans]
MTTEKKKKNIVVPIILGVLLVIGIVFGIVEWNYYSKHVDTDDAQIDGDISPVVARVGGYVKDINFEENTHVTEGQVLVKLDDNDYKVKLEQAQSGQKGASAGVGVAQSQIAATQANTSTAKANVTAARVKLNLANKDYARYANLIKDGSITQQAFDQAKASKESAEAAFQAAQDQYNAAVKQVGTTQSQLAVSSNVISQRQSDIDFAKLQLSYTDIKAPATGLVSKKNVQKGQLIQPGQSLFSIVNDGSIYVTANFKETQLEKIKSGSKVEIEVDAYPDEKIQGEVYNFSPITGAKGSLLPPDNATGNFVKVVQRIPVKIKIHPSKEMLAKLRPGMSVKASVSTK